MDKKQKGSVLIICLFIIFFLSALSLIISSAIRTKIKITRRYQQKQKLFYQAHAVLNQAILELEKDRLRNKSDSFHDFWFQEFQKKDGQLKKINFPDNNSEEILNVKIIDEQSKINVNNASLDMIKSITLILGKKINNDFAKNMLNYRNNVLGNRKIVSVWQLRQMNIMEDGVFLGEDTNDNGRLDPEEDDANNSYPADNGDGILDLGVKDFFTVYSNGKININTASMSVLKSMPEMSEEIAEAVVKARAEKVFEKIEDLKELSFITNELYQNIAQWAVVSSNVFKISVTAWLEEDKIQKQIIAVVDRSYTPMKILYWQEI
ncbi:MAG: helix-hairpin-helix domain-containing protein [Candidatus Omnitrophota bacterium]